MKKISTDLTCIETVKLRYKRAIQFARQVRPLMTSEELRAQVEVKPDGSLVTGLDKEINRRFEALVRESVFTGDQIVSEETEADFDQKNESCWVIDPVDGTANYAHGRLPYAVSIGYVLGKEPIFGVVIAPGMNGFKIISAFKGHGVSVNNRPFFPRTPVKPMAGLDFKNSEADKLARGVSALLADAHQRDDNDLNNDGFKEVRVIGSIVSGLMEVALGSLSVYAHASPRSWDVAAGLAILREAGKVTNVDDLDLAALAAGGHRLGYTIAAQDSETMAKTAAVLGQAVQEATALKILKEIPHRSRL